MSSGRASGRASGRDSVMMAGPGLVTVTILLLALCVHTGIISPSQMFYILYLIVLLNKVARLLEGQSLDP